MQKFIPILVLSVLLTVPALANRDSIGVKTIAGKMYILHKVAKGEGLYGIGRRYNVSVAQIQEADPSVNQGIAPNQVILIPYIKGSKNASTVKNEPKKPEVKPVVKNDPQPKTETKPKTGETKTVKKAVTHKVAAGETLYRISVNYKVSVDEIKSWNKLTNNEISVGDELIVGYKNEKVTVNEKPFADGSIRKKDDDDDGEKPVVQNNENPRKGDYIDEKYEKELTDAEKRQALAKSKGQWKEVSESGVATWIDDGSIVSEKKLALHKSAPLGTIIQVTNPMNNEKVYVKVIGRLQPTEDEANVVLKITKSTASKLGLRDKYFRLDMNYGMEVIK